MTTYRVFTRRPWKRNPKFPQGWEPHGGARKTTVEKAVTLEQAKRLCKAGNAGKPRKPGQTWYEFESN